MTDIETRLQGAYDRLPAQTLADIGGRNLKYVKVPESELNSLWREVVAPVGREAIAAGSDAIVLFLFDVHRGGERIGVEAGLSARIAGVEYSDRTWQKYAGTGIFGSSGGSYLYYVRA